MTTVEYPLQVPCSALKRTTLAGHVLPSGASVRPSPCRIFGPPRSSTATAPPSVHRSAYEIVGCSRSEEEVPSKSDALCHGRGTSAVGPCALLRSDATASSRSNRLENVTHDVQPSVGAVGTLGSESHGRAVASCMPAHGNRSHLRNDALLPWVTVGHLRSCRTCRRSPKHARPACTVKSPDR
jgi:hypothetical protein